MNAIAKNILNALDKAIGAQPAEPAAPDPFARVREIVATGSAQEGNARRSYFHRTTPEVFEQIGLRTPVPPETVSALREIHAQWRELWDEHVAYGKRRVAEDYQNYLAEQSAKILNKEEVADFFNEQEFRNERQAKLASQKHALFQLTLKAHKTLLPYFDNAIATARTLMSEELEVAIAVAERWGLPLTEPPAHVAAIGAAIEFYQQRKTPPTGLASIRDIAIQIVNL